jgi:hypothetical protein
MSTATRPAPHHEKLTCYTDYRCRRPECVERYRTWDNDRARAHADGTWDNLIDAEPVRLHLTQLDAAGVGTYSVATLTGLGYKIVRGITGPYCGEPRRRRVAPETAAKILAISPGDRLPPTVDSLGSRRRVQALVAIGWPSLHTARRAGVDPTNRTVILNRKQIRRITAERFEAAYEDMCRRRPANHGVSRTSIKRAKLQARANRWAPPKYWAAFPGAIDDPHFESMYGLTSSDRLAEDGLWLETTQGYTRELAAARLGVTKEVLQKSIDRSRDKQGRAAVAT